MIGALAVLEHLVEEAAWQRVAGGAQQALAPLQEMLALAQPVQQLAALHKGGHHLGDGLEHLELVGQHLLLRIARTAQHEAPQAAIDQERQKQRGAHPGFAQQLLVRGAAGQQRGDGAVRRIARPQRCDQRRREA